MANGRYAIVARATWGPHAVTNDEIFVTWIFDVIVDEE